jgi:hypothetical protein
MFSMKRRQKIRRMGVEEEKKQYFFSFARGKKRTGFFNFARGAAAGLFFVEALGERERASP